jgi:hypothetical protein
MKTKTLLSVLLLFAAMFSASAQKTVGLEFDANDSQSFVNLGDLGQSSSNFTLEFWTSVDNPAAGGYFVSNEGWDATLGNMGFSIRLNVGDPANQLIEFAGGASDGSWPTVTAPIMQAQTWVHIAASYDGTTMNLYIDGILAGSNEPGAAITPSTQQLILGEGAMWKDRRITAKMSDFRYWDAIRTQQQIADNKDAYLTGTPAGLLANWKFNEGVGTALVDETGNYTATLGAAVQWFNVSTGVDESTIPGTEFLKVYQQLPNGNIIIKNESNSSSDYSIADLTGNILRSGIIQSNSTLSINTASFSKGIYIVSARNGDQLNVKKTIVQ